MHADCEVVRSTDRQMEQKSSGNQKMYLCEPDLQDLIEFVEEETFLMNDPLFSREALMSTPCILKCYTKVHEKNEMTVEQTETVASRKCKFCDGNHDLDNCQFYHEIT